MHLLLSVLPEKSSSIIQGHLPRNAHWNFLCENWKESVLNQITLLKKMDLLEIYNEIIYGLKRTHTDRSQKYDVEWVCEEMNDNGYHIIPCADIKYIKSPRLRLVGTSICSKCTKIYRRITHQTHDSLCLQERQGEMRLWKREIEVFTWFWKSIQSLQSEASMTQC